MILPKQEKLPEPKEVDAILEKLKFSDPVQERFGHTLLELVGFLGALEEWNRVNGTLLPVEMEPWCMFHGTCVFYRIQEQFKNMSKVEIMNRCSFFDAIKCQRRVV